jgi:hypothetical protein
VARHSFLASSCNIGSRRPEALDEYQPRLHHFVAGTCSDFVIAIKSARTTSGHSKPILLELRSMTGCMHHYVYGFGYCTVDAQDEVAVLTVTMASGDKGVRVSLPSYCSPVLLHRQYYRQLDMLPVASSPQFGRCQGICRVPQIGEGDSCAPLDTRCRPYIVQCRLDAPPTLKDGAF